MKAPSSSPKQPTALVIGREEQYRIQLQRVHDAAERMIELAKANRQLTETELSWLKQHGLQVAAAADKLEKLT